jgi:hypothetical protein
MRRVTLLAIIAALSLPSPAAADYVALVVNPTKVAPGWTLSGLVTSGSFYRSDEIVGLTLQRSFLAGRGEEKHALRAHPREATISFAGVSGSWKTSGQLGNAGAVDLAIEATGAPTPVDEAWGCRGAFARVPVRLDGALTLRTGTRFFKTIRRARLAGYVIFDQGAVNCDRPQPSECTASSSFSAGTARSSVVAAPRSMVLQFRDPVARSSAGAAWYHVMTVDGYDAVTGSLPELGVRGRSPTLRGNARFLAGEATQSHSGACLTTRTSGAATGSFSSTFVGWGARTLRLNAGVPASFSESR